MKLKDCIGYPVRMEHKKSRSGCQIIGVLKSLHPGKGYAIVRPVKHGYDVKVPIRLVRPWIKGVAKANRQRGAG